MDTSRSAPDGRSSRWDEHRLARREELVEATLRAVREHGAGVGMDEVAAAARTSKTVFYRHFTDRAGLYTAVAERVDATILRGLTRAAGASEPDDTRAVLREVIATYLRLVEDDPEVYRFVVNAPIVPAGERPEGDVAAGMTHRIATHVAQLVTGGRVGDSPAPRLWGVALVGMVRATADAWLASGAGDRGPSSTQLADDLTALAWEGLSSVTVTASRA